MGTSSAPSIKVAVTSPGHQSPRTVSFPDFGSPLQSSCPEAGYSCTHVAPWLQTQRSPGFRLFPEGEPMEMDSGRQTLELRQQVEKQKSLRIESSQPSNQKTSLSLGLSHAWQRGMDGAWQKEVGGPRCGKHGKNGDKHFLSTCSMPCSAKCWRCVTDNLWGRNLHPHFTHVSLGCQM